MGFIRLRPACGALAISSKERVLALDPPDSPGPAKAGSSRGYDHTFSFGLYAPAGTPPADNQAASRGGGQKGLARRPR